MGEAVAALLQKQNVDHRMDNMDVEVQSSDGEHLGSCPFPECKFLNKEEEKDAFFLTQANEKMRSVVKKNRSITFVRKEEGTFADTNLPLSRAMETYGGGKITKQEDPVTFYYYKTKSQEFYIADFLDTDTGNWYTSFDLSLEKQKKGFFHVNVNIGSD